MRAEGPYYLEYDPNVRVAGNEQSVSSITARYRYLHRTRDDPSFRTRFAI